MVFATRAFHRVNEAPFVLQCDHFLRAFSTDQEGAVAFALDGPAGVQAKLSLIRQGGGRHPRFEASLHGAEGEIRALKEPEGEGVLCQFAIPAQGAYTLRWEQ